MAGIGKPARSPIVKATGAIKELDELSGSVPETADGLEGYFLKELFPLLDLSHWVASLLDGLRCDEVMTYGAAAAALGAPKGARAIAEWTSLGRIKGPTDRLVRKDELGPNASAVTPIMEPQPFAALSRVQSSMGPMLEPGDGRVRDSFIGLDISTLGGSQASALVEVSAEGVVLSEASETSAPLFPYVPGFLFYKEAPHLMPLVKDALKRGVSAEGVLVLDGNGTIHPRGMGIACQLGMAMDMASMGIAKRLLCGSAGRWEAMDGTIEIAAITDMGRTIGHGVRRVGRRPSFASRGHRTDQTECLGLSVDVVSGRIPSPTGLAHRLANEARRSEP